MAYLLEVVFNDTNPHTYSYLCRQPDVEVGDKVVVKVNGKFKIVEVVSVSDYDVKFVEAVLGDESDGY